jgi:hypothetical protein
VVRYVDDAVMLFEHEEDATIHIWNASYRETGVLNMEWVQPVFEEIDMNAEIGGYQSDGPPIIKSEQEAAERTE